MCTAPPSLDAPKVFERVDNDTSDPLLVSPVILGDAGNNKWVVPGCRR
jgi:hypothetical protein